MPKRSRHGKKRPKVALKVQGWDAIDVRTAAARRMLAWKAELEAALGGSELSPQRSALIDVASRTRLFLDSCDAWLVQQESVIVKRRSAVRPVLLQRQILVDSLVRILSQLGLDRQAKQVPVQFGTSRGIIEKLGLMLEPRGEF